MPVTAFSSISGPTSTPSSWPRPTVSAAIRSPSFSVNSPATEECTRKRLAEVQASPMLRILAIIAPSTAASTSASPKTRNGALPPSSIETRWRFSAAWATSFLPTAVEPVKETLRSRASAISAAETSWLSEVVTTCSTPSGRPASANTSASLTIVSGVLAAGFTITVQPAAKAGPILRVPIARGKFHGVMNRHGPTGLRSVSSRDPPAGALSQLPPTRTASSLNQRRNSAP